MMSLTNTYNADELRAFDERVRRETGLDVIDYDFELKIDGNISLIYRQGDLDACCDTATASLEKTLPLMYAPSTRSLSDSKIRSTRSSAGRSTCPSAPLLHQMQTGWQKVKLPLLTAVTQRPDPCAS